MIWGRYGCPAYDFNRTRMADQPADCHRYNVIRDRRPKQIRQSLRVRVRPIGAHACPGGAGAGPAVACGPPALGCAARCGRARGPHSRPRGLPPLDDRRRESRHSIPGLEPVAARCPAKPPFSRARYRHRPGRHGLVGRRPAARTTRRYRRPRAPTHWPRRTRHAARVRALHNAGSLRTRHFAVRARRPRAPRTRRTCGRRCYTLASRALRRPPRR